MCVVNNSTYSYICKVHSVAKEIKLDSNRESECNYLKLLTTRKCWAKPAVYYQFYLNIL